MQMAICMKPNAEEFTDFKNTRIDLNNRLCQALTKDLKPCKYYRPGQNLPIAQNKKKRFMLHVNIRFLQKI